MEKRNCMPNLNLIHRFLSRTFRSSTTRYHLLLINYDLRHGQLKFNAIYDIHYVITV
jgi:hypothetical protein